jgi:hypothetical protein
VPRGRPSHGRFVLLLAASFLLAAAVGGETAKRERDWKPGRDQVAANVPEALRVKRGWPSPSSGQCTSGTPRLAQKSKGQNVGRVGPATSDSSDRTALRVALRRLEDHAPANRHRRPAVERRTVTELAAVAEAPAVRGAGAGEATRVVEARRDAHQAAHSCGQDEGSQRIAVRERAPAVRRAGIGDTACVEPAGRELGEAADSGRQDDCVRGPMLRGSLWRSARARHPPLRQTTRASRPIWPYRQAHEATTRGPPAASSAWQDS